jgi:hypothetical protein
MMMTPEHISPGFSDWPETWCGVEKDVPYGDRLIEAMRPFITDLIHQGLKNRTIRNHMDNLWLLGGEIIRNVSTHNQYKTPPERMLRLSVDENGGLYCRHLTTDAELRSYEATCKKLHKFLAENV